jgi:hypothetical protein
MTVNAMHRDPSSANDASSVRICSAIAGSPSSTMGQVTSARATAQHNIATARMARPGERIVAMLPDRAPPSRARSQIARRTGGERISGGPPSLPERAMPWAANASCSKIVHSGPRRPSNRLRQQRPRLWPQVGRKSRANSRVRVRAFRSNAGRAGDRQRPHHDGIELYIGAEPEWRYSDLFEAAPGVKRNRAMVVFPDG